MEEKIFNFVIGLNNESMTLMKYKEEFMEHTSLQETFAEIRRE